MKTEKIQLLIEAFKKDFDMYTLFGQNVAYNSFFRDLDDLGLIIEPLYTKKIDCYTNTLVQIQVISAKTETSRIDMRKYMEKVEKFLSGKLKNFAGFETISVYATGDEMLLKNNKERLVFVKRFNFYF